MAATLVNSTEIKSSPGSAPSASIGTVGAGNLLVALVSYYSSGFNGAITVSDDKGNTWTTNEGNATNSTRGAIAYAENAASGATTVTVTSSGTGDQYITAVIAEFSGVLTSGAFDVDVSNAGSSTSANSGNTATLAQADSLVVGVIGSEADNVLPDAVVDTGYTNLARIRTNATYQPINAGYKNVSATTAQSASNTIGSALWVALCAVFKNGAAGPTITSQPSNATAYSGQTAQFSVTATGTGGLTYQWQRSTDFGLTYSNVSGGSGGTTATYTTPTLGFTEDRYFYRCAVTDTNGTTNSNGARLTLIPMSPTAWLRA